MPMLRRLTGCIVAIFFAAGCATAKTNPSADILRAMERVADWQLAHPSERKPDGWVQAAGYAGMMALAEISTNSAYRDAMLAMGDLTEPSK